MTIIGFSGLDLPERNVALFENRKDGVYYYEDVLYRVKFAKDDGKILNFDEPIKPEDTKDFAALGEYTRDWERYERHAENYESAVTNLDHQKICNLFIKIVSCSKQEQKGKDVYVYNCLVKFHNRPEMEIQLDVKAFSSATQFNAALMSQTPGGCFIGTNKDLDEFKKTLFEDLDNIPCK